MSTLNFSLSREDWSLHRKGQQDQERHQAKVREAIRRNLPDVVSQENIILSDGARVVRVPIRSLEEFRLRFDDDKTTHAGQGRGGSRVGDRVAVEPGRGGAGAGEEPGGDVYEAEITLDELADLIFADLDLPRLRPRTQPQLGTAGEEFRELRRVGVWGNLDRRRTLLENLRRNARTGRRGVGDITREDLRFKTWEESPRQETAAAVLAMMDTSGSMGEFQKYIARSFFFWLVRFLRTRYRQVQIAFLAHDATAREVTEEDFFHRGESGGTRCSSVYELASRVVEERYPPAGYNVYAFHFSDGDNYPEDNPRCVERLRELLERVELLGYGEIAAAPEGSGLLKTLAEVHDPRFVAVRIAEKRDVYRAIRAFLGPAAEVGSR